MNVCTFVGEIIGFLDLEEKGLDVQISVSERYTNSRGEKKTEKLIVYCKAFSSAAKYIQKNAKKGDAIAARCSYYYNHDVGYLCDYYFRINDFQIIKKD